MKLRVEIDLEKVRKGDEMPLAITMAGIPVFRKTYPYDPHETGALDKASHRIKQDFAARLSKLMEE